MIRGWNYSTAEVVPPWLRSYCKYMNGGSLYVEGVEDPIQSGDKILLDEEVNKITVQKLVRVKDALDLDEEERHKLKCALSRYSSTLRQISDEIDRFLINDG